MVVRTGREADVAGGVFCPAGERQGHIGLWGIRSITASTLHHRSIQVIEQQSQTSLRVIFSHHKLVANNSH